MIAVDSSQTLNYLAIATLLVLVTVTIYSRQKSRLPVPPGPKGLPILGNIFQFPREKEWEVYAQWAKTYGKIMSLHAFGSPIIIINDHDTAVKLLDKRSLTYSSRPVMPMLTEAMGWKDTLGFSPYGEQFRRYRKLIHQFIGTRTAAERFAPIMEGEMKAFLRRVVETPEDIRAHIRRQAGATVLMMAYGIPIQQENDPVVQVVDEALQQLAQASTPGAFLVDTLPIIQYIPDWFPGNSWKKIAVRYKKTLYDMVESPYNKSKRLMAEGNAVSSYTTDMLQAKPHITEKEEKEIKWSAASLYGAGADTSVSVVLAFILAMTLHPEIQRKAQEEVDRVIGNDRLPTLSDRGSLPYIEAIILEVLRWQPIVPLNIPHTCTVDDEYDGYRIPKGAIIMVNIWLLFHDAKVHPDPDTFNPDRFLATKDKPAERDPREIVFGFGRRACPGRHVADATVFLSVASILSTLNISRVVEDGKEVIPVHDSSSGGVSHPLPFKCNIQPRSNKARQLIFDGK